MVLRGRCRVQLVCTSDCSVRFPCLVSSVTVWFSGLVLALLTVFPLYRRLFGVNLNRRWSLASDKVSDY